MSRVAVLRSSILVVGLLLVSTGLLHPATTGSEVVARAGAGELVVTADGAERQLIYRLGPSAAPQILRRSSAPLRDLRLVATGIEDVVFVSWREQVLSTDGGATWTEARAIRFDIPLRSGALTPEREAYPVPKALEATSANSIYIVQFHTRSLAAWRHRVQELGAEVLSYMPHNAHLVRMDEATAQLVAAETPVRWVGPYHPFYRVAPQLLDEIDAPEFGTRRFVLMTFVPGAAEKARLAQDVTAIGGSVVLQNAKGYLMEAELDADQALELLHSNSLNWLELWAAEEEDMDLGRELYGANYIESVGGYDGTGVRAEVQDSGIDPNHQDFDGILIHGGTPNWSSHGTATYGIVFGNGDRDGDGQARATGFLPGAQGYFSDVGNVADLYTHVGEIVSDPINGVFMTRSVGDPRTLHYTALSAQFDDIAWTYDFTIFQSQSNSGDQYSRPQAWAKNVVSIGGIKHYDDLDPGNDNWTDGASIGPAEDGRIKPDLSFWYDWIYTTAPGDTYTSAFGGTSGATPMAAGTSGLVFQMWADNIYGNNPAGGTVFEKRPHFTTLKAIMVNTAEQYPFSGPLHDRTRVRQGWGIPSLRNVYDRAGMTGIIDEDSVLEELQFDAYTASVPVEGGEGELKVTMVYADRAANPAATVHTVNDVTLRVIAPDGTLYWGNHGLHEGVWSTPGGGPDPRNTVENVFVDNPMPGDWRIEVHAHEINMDVHAETPEDDQDYALVVYGVDSFTECRSGVSVPTGVSVDPTGDNQVTVSWSGSSAQYEVWRSEGGCGLPAVLVGTTASTTFVDDTVPGGVLHGYTVRGLDGCPSQDSACVEITTTGPCGLPPHFAGLEGAVGTPAAGCNVSLGWTAGASRCGGSVVYNVYRSIDPDFTPSAANRVAQCVSGTSWLDDSGLDQAQLYTYIVRAEDPTAGGAGPCGGVEDPNTRRRTLTPTSLIFTDFEAGLEGWDVFEWTGTSFPHITGEFVADSQRATFWGGTPAQPGIAASGQQCLFTARNPNGQADRADVDSGEVWALSPIFDASGLVELKLDFWRWYYAQRTTDDYFAADVSNNGGAGWTNLETLVNSSGYNSWNQVTFALHDFVPLTATMRLRVRVGDFGTGGITEGAFDAVHVWNPVACGSPLIFQDGFELGDTSAWSGVGP